MHSRNRQQMGKVRSAQRVQTIAPHAGSIPCHNGGGKGPGLACQPCLNTRTDSDALAIHPQTTLPVRCSNAQQNGGACVANSTQTFKPRHALKIKTAGFDGTRGRRQMPCHQHHLTRFGGDEPLIPMQGYARRGRCAPRPQSGQHDTVQCQAHSIRRRSVNLNNAPLNGTIIAKPQNRLGDHIGPHTSQTKATHHHRERQHPNPKTVRNDPLKQNNKTRAGQKRRTQPKSRFFIHRKICGHANGQQDGRPTKAMTALGQYLRPKSTHLLSPRAIRITRPRPANLNELVVSKRLISHV